MPELEKNESSENKSFPITRLQLFSIVIVTLLIGMSLPSIFSWVKQKCSPAKDDGLVETISKDPYDSFDKCPSLDASGVQVKIVSWDADTKQYIYRYKVNVD